MIEERENDHDEIVALKSSLIVSDGWVGYYKQQNKQLIKANIKECKWLLEEDTCWESQCRQSFIFNDKGPVHNGFKYCPYCGGKMIQDEKEN